MTKVVILNRNDDICADVIKHTGAEHRRLANRVMEEALEQAGVSFDEISCVIATGYGRITVPFADRQITELTCHARGVYHYVPSAKLAIDVGGQDAKGLKMNCGKLLDFVMSDKCAAGTGRFLELIAASLDLKLDDMGKLSLKSTGKASISSTCTVFARQEVVTRISEGVSLEDILAGIHDAIASRITRMVEKLKIEPDVVFTGGVAKNIGIVKSLETKLGFEVMVPEEPLLSGAIGAALLGKEITLKALAQGKPVQRGRRSLSESTFFQ
jgi:predicted CoA-substrate-specific enzyme activase